MDEYLFRKINSVTGQFSLLDFFMIFVSKKIRYVYIIILVIMWFRNRKITINAVLSVVITLLINIIIRSFYFKARPFLKHRVGILIPSAVDSSFPSKHTLLAFAVTTSILLYQRTFGLIMLGLSFLTGLSRIWMGHHYPSDIAGSAIIGTLTSIVIHKTSNFFKFFSRQT